MKLSELLKEIQYTRLIMPKEEVDVLGVNIDSRLKGRPIHCRKRNTDRRPCIHHRSRRERCCSYSMRRTAGKTEPEHSIHKCNQCAEHNRKTCHHILWQSFAKAQTRRRNRYKRQDNHRHTALYPIHRVRTQMRSIVNRMQLHKWQSLSIDPYHSRCHIAQPTVGNDGGRGLRIRFHGGKFACSCTRESGRS